MDAYDILEKNRDKEDIVSYYSVVFCLTEQSTNLFYNARVVDIVGTGV